MKRSLRSRHKLRYRKLSLASVVDYTETMRQVIRLTFQQTNLIKDYHFIRNTLTQ